MGYVTFADFLETANGKRQTANGKRQTANGKRQTAMGQWGNGAMGQWADNIVGTRRGVFLWTNGQTHVIEGVVHEPSNKMRQEHKTI